LVNYLKEIRDTPTPIEAKNVSKDSPLSTEKFNVIQRTFPTPLTPGIRLQKLSLRFKANFSCFAFR